MKPYFLFFILPFFVLVSCAQNKSTPKNNLKNTVQENSQEPKKSTQQPESAKEQPEKYAPPIVKHGIKFSIPSSWENTTEEFKATDLKGNIVSVQSAYQDSNDQSTINFTFHPGEKGKKIYAYKLKKIGKNSKRIIIADKEAIQAIEVLETDGKGHQLDTPTKRIIVSLLTKEGEMDFVINANSQASQATFNDFISKIEF